MAANSRAIVSPLGSPAQSRVPFGRSHDRAPSPAIGTLVHAPMEGIVHIERTNRRPASSTTSRTASYELGLRRLRGLTR